MAHVYSVYILASRSRRLYIGVTRDIQARLQLHRSGHCTFTNRYRIERLVYVESTDSVTAAIAREKQLKGWRRDRKLALIEVLNPAWNELAPGWFGMGPIERSRHGVRRF